MRFFLILSVVVFVGCSGYEKSINSAKEANPSINIIDSVENCDNELCYLEVTSDEELNQDNTNISFNWLMFANTSVFFSTEEDKIPRLKFSLVNIDDDAVKKVVYKYYKQDLTGKKIYEGTQKELLKQNDAYVLRYNVVDLAPALVNSFPEETQNIEISIIDTNNTKYTYLIKFKLKSLEIEAIHVARSLNIMSLPYYNDFIPNDSGEFLLDKIEITNTQNRNFILNGSLFLDNKTNALVNLKNKEQRIINLGKPNQYYPNDIYEWSIVNDTNSSYRKVSANPNYILKLQRGEVLEDLNFMIEETDTGKQVIIKNLEIDSNESLNLLIFARFNINDTLLGTHGSKKFYTGLSFYNSLMDPLMCNYFYTYDVYSGTGSNLNRSLYYFSANSYIYMLSERLYPNCGEIPSVLNKTVHEEYAPENVVNLTGRRHSFNHQIYLEVKESGYDGEGFQTINKTFDFIEVKEGNYEESLINYDYIYSGYVI